MSDGDCCSHMFVRYQMEESRPGLVIRGWWACTDCNQEFVPIHRPTHYSQLGADGKPLYGYTDDRYPQEIVEPQPIKFSLLDHIRGWWLKW